MLPETSAPAQADPVGVGVGVAAGFPGRRGYLNTASCGLPSAQTLRDLEQALGEWRDGHGGSEQWDGAVQECRALYAELMGVPASWVAVGSQVSAFVGVVAASLPAGTTVLCAEEDFTSVLFPFLAQVDRGVRVRVVPLDELVDAVREGVHWVAVSAAQSADGRCLDLDRLAAAADLAGSRVLLDVTQSAGWLPCAASRFAVTVGAGYKWLLQPRGTAYATVAPGVLRLLRPHLAGWYAGEVVGSSYYGPPMRLATDARRLDLSPAWFSWAGGVAGLRLLRGVGVEAVHAHDVRLADAFRGRLGLPPVRSAIVSVPGDDAVRGRLAAAGARVAGRAGRVRLAFHLYNDDEDVDLAAACWRR